MQFIILNMINVLNKNMPKLEVKMQLQILHEKHAALQSEIIPKCFYFISQKEFF